MHGSVRLSKGCLLHDNPSLCACGTVVLMVLVGGYVLNFLRPHNVYDAFEQPFLNLNFIII